MLPFAPLRIPLLAVFLWLALPAIAQQNAPNPVSYSANLHAGFIIPHSKSIVDVSRSFPRALGMDISWLLHDRRYTDRSGMIIRRGFSLMAVDFNNPDVLGYNLSLSGFVEPLIRPDRRLYTSVRLGAGLAFLSKVYDEERNPRNLFFSTRLSFLLLVNPNLSFKINDNWQVSAGVSYNHISNGGVKLPNKGMNFPTGTVGIAYQPRPVVISRLERSGDWRSAQTLYAYFHTASSLKTVNASGPEEEAVLKPLYGVAAVAGKRVGRISALAVGTEWIYDAWTREMLDRLQQSESAWRGSALFGYELLANKVRFSVHLGAYLYNPTRFVSFTENDVLYQRYGLFYTFGKNFQVGTTLKAHRHVAEVFDLRIGYKIGY